jgi:hypothetical protein
MAEDTTTSGFLIEKTFARMYCEFLADQRRYHPERLNTGRYSTPRTDVPPEQVPKRYRGLQREPMQDWYEVFRGSGVVEPTDQELAACLFITELEKAGKVVDDMILALEDGKEVLKKVEPPVEREIIWTRRMDAKDEAPAGMVLLGYDPSVFYLPTCDSAIGEGMFFPSPGSCDEEGSRFKMCHEKLNRWGLFDAPSDAEEYLKDWLSFLPPDTDPHFSPYYIAEVRALAAGDNA